MKALAIASGIVFWTLMIGVAVLFFLPGGDSEPVAVITIEPAQPGSAPAPAAAAAPSATRGVDLPPGFSVTPPTMTSQPLARPPAQQRPPMLAPPGQGTNMVPVAPGQLRLPAPGPGGSLQQGPDGAPPTEAHAANESATPQARVPPPVVTGEITLAAVPAPGLVEKSKYGPLPKIAIDGRRPAEVYARPLNQAQAAAGPARVAVLVSGLGVPGAPPDSNVIKGLPPPVSIAYGAYGRSLQERVTKARADGHEVLLAIPLEPNDYPAEDPGPHTLLTTLPTDENIKRLHWLMSRYTGYVGVTNHMGAKFEATEGSLQPVLAELKKRGLLYLDKGSIGSSTGLEIANGIGLDYAVTQVQLDGGNSSADMAKALAELEATAKANGTAIGVANAGPATAKQIAEWAGSLKSKGLVLVPVSAAMRAQRQS